MKTICLLQTGALLLFQLLTACNAGTDEKNETKTVFDPQIQVLEKARQTEDMLQKAEQERAKQMRDQGL